VIIDRLKTYIFRRQKWKVAFPDYLFKGLSKHASYSIRRKKYCQENLAEPLYEDNHLKKKEIKYVRDDVQWHVRTLQDYRIGL